MKQKSVFGMALACACIALFIGIWLAQSQRYDFKTLSGETYQHADLIDHIIVVNYFAEWCAPCLREIPELNDFHEQANKNIKLFAISFDTLTPEKLHMLKTKYDIKFPLISELKTSFPFPKPSYLPATFVIKENGEVAGQLLGEQTVKSLNEAISVL